jgi:hypothetical protein
MLQKYTIKNLIILIMYKNSYNLRVSSEQQKVVTWPKKTLREYERGKPKGKVIYMVLEDDETSHSEDVYSVSTHNSSIGNSLGSSFAMLEIVSSASWKISISIVEEHVIGSSTGKEGFSA